MSTSTVAMQLIDPLRHAGVERIYGLVGGSLNPIVDAIRRTDGIEWIHVHNEEAGAFAAAADAQLTGRLAVCWELRHRQHADHPAQPGDRPQAR